MKIVIRVIDFDLDFAKSLSSKLEKLLKDYEFKAINVPFFIEPNSDEIFFDIYNPDQFPMLEGGLKLFTDDPFLDNSSVKPESKLFRFSPISAIANEVQNLLISMYPELEKRQTVEAFISASSNENLLISIANSIRFSSNKYKYILNIGPSYLFPASNEYSKYNSSEYLMQLSLRQFKTEDLGKYIEESPWIVNARRIRLARHPDDWLFINEDVFRRSIEIYVEWLNTQVPDYWELYIISLNMPHKLNMIIASKVSKLYTHSSLNPVKDNLYFSELIAALPQNSTYEVFDESGGH